MADQNGDSDVEESRLGRQEYWEETYQQELVNLRELDDEGEVWFGSDVLETMASWTDELLKSRSPDSAALAILDVGTGNGSFLFKLAQRGYRQLTGSDYSAASIQLAAEIAARRRVDTITWVQDDLLAAQLSGRFDVITDKGTLDAVGLSANAGQNRVRYKEAVWQMLKSNGLLIITSCNSTANELQEEFCRLDGVARFTFVDKIRTYPVFKFGGIEGTRVCTVCFQRAA